MTILCYKITKSERFHNVRRAGNTLATFTPIIVESVIYVLYINTLLV